MGPCIPEHTSWVNEATNYHTVSAKCLVEFNCLCAGCVWSTAKNGRQFWTRRSIANNRMRRPMGLRLFRWSSTTPRQTFYWAPAAIQFLWMVQIEMYFREWCMHSEKAWLQCTQQPEIAQFFWELRKHAAKVKSFWHWRKMLLQLVWCCWIRYSTITNG